MILSDADILERLEEGDLVIDPIDDYELQIQPASVDMRLGQEFLEFQRTNIPCIHPTSEGEVDEYVTETVVDNDDECFELGFGQQAGKIAAEIPDGAAQFLAAFGA